MIFRKDSLLLYEQEIGIVFSSILSLVMIPIFKSLSITICALILIVIAAVNPLSYNEFIQINKSGISCQKAGKQIWAYEWDDIVTLKKSRRYNMPSMEIVVSNKYRTLWPCQGIENAKYSGHYFQLSRTAKKALELYYKPREITQKK